MDEFNAVSDVPNTNGKYCCGSFCCSDFALPTILFITAECCNDVLEIDKV